MSHKACSDCGRPVRLLAFTSSLAIADYCRCDACGQVWAHDRRHPELPPQRVTNRPQRASSNGRRAQVLGGAAPAGSLHFCCPRCHQAMEPWRAVPVERNDTDTSLIYRCATDGYWQVYDTGRAVRAGAALAIDPTA